MNTTTKETNFDRLFQPEAVAIVGASSTKLGMANIFIEHLRNFGFKGAIYPIHPTAETIQGLKAFPSFQALPADIDYAYVAVPPEHVAHVLEEMRGRVCFTQVVSSGFGEVKNGKKLEAALIEAAHRGGTRILGPNCLGTYSPRGKLTFLEGVPVENGAVGIISQSGGLGIDILRRGASRGIRYSGLVTLGNSADVSPCDLLEFYFEDPVTRVIGIYLEDVKDGKRFFRILRDHAGQKPVILLVGGRTQQGRQAAASHTGALAQDDRIWAALSKQTGAILVDTLEQFLDVLLAFQFITPRTYNPNQQVALFGNGGGTSVLAADFFARNGLKVVPFSDKTQSALLDLNLPPGSSLVNPVDTPVGTLRKDDGLVAKQILDAILAHERPNALVMHLNMSAILNFNDNRVDLMKNLMHSAISVLQDYPGQTHFFLVLRSDGSPELEERKRLERHKALEMKIPVYDELTNAAIALSAIAKFEQFKMKI